MDRKDIFHVIFNDVWGCVSFRSYLLGVFLAGEEMIPVYGSQGFKQVDPAENPMP